MKKLLVLIIIPFLVYSCTKDRKDNIDYFKTHAATQVDTTGNVLINEFVAAGSTNVSELGLASDWIELYHTGDSTVDFSRTNLYITDDSTAPDKFKIDQLSIPGKGYLVIFCDDSNEILTQVHTNFGLSKTGEFVGLYKKDAQGNFIPLTEHPFGAQGTNISEGRYPDGGTNWTNFTSPTPGAPNHL